MRMMATLELPDSGKITVNGWDVANRPHEVRQSIGWMPDNYGAYTHVSVLDYLDFYARASDLQKGLRRQTGQAGPCIPAR